MALVERYAGDPELQQFYTRKLIEPGWAGDLSPEEFTYIRAELQKSPSLRRHWGFRPTARRLSEDHIRKVAGDGLCVIRR